MIMMIYILIIICMILQCTNAFIIKSMPSLSSKRIYMSSEISSLHDTLFNKVKDKFTLKETFFAEDKGINVNVIVITIVDIIIYLFLLLLLVLL